MGMVSSGCSWASCRDRYFWLRQYVVVSSASRVLPRCADAVWPKPTVTTAVVVLVVTAAAVAVVVVIVVAVVTLVVDVVVVVDSSWPADSKIHSCLILRATADSVEIEFNGFSGACEKGARSARLIAGRWGLTDWVH